MTYLLKYTVLEEEKIYKNTNHFLWSVSENTQTSNNLNIWNWLRVVLVMHTHEKKNNILSLEWPRMCLTSLLYNLFTWRIEDIYFSGGQENNLCSRTGQYWPFCNKITAHVIIYQSLRNSVANSDLKLTPTIYSP